jgi:tetratricopeptide (TPR) repeat protein
MRSRVAPVTVPLIVAAACALAAGQDRLTEKGWDHFYNLEYADALAAFRAEAAMNPDSADAQNHIAQTILYREMFRSGALESELVTGGNPFLRRPKLNPSAEEEKEFFDAIARAMDLANARIAAQPAYARAYYSLGVSYGLRANYRFLVKKAWLDSLRDATAARKAHKRATDIDPNFIDALLVQGVYDYVAGSLPFHWKMLGFIAGFHGDRERGIATLRRVAAEGRVNRSDAAILLCAIYRRERRALDAIPLLDRLIEQYPRNYLLRLEMVQMYADAGKKDEALAVINQVIQLKRRHVRGYDQLPEEKIRYTRGNLLFWYNDLDQALEDLKAVTENADSVDLNTGVYAWLRVGQIHDLKGERSEALAAYREAMRYAPESDAAREAREYTESRYRR